MRQIILSLTAASLAATGLAQTPTLSGSTPTDTLTTTLELHEVTVKAPPKTRINGDAIVTRIVGTPIAGAGTASDALAKVPGIIVQNGELQVVGKGAPTYYVNGRKVCDLTELQRLSSHDIKDVEVITTPGAGYDAQTSAVVRIRTLRRRTDGLGVAIDLRDEQALSCSNNRLGSTLNLNYRQRSASVFATVAYGNDRLGRYATEVEQQTFGNRGFYRQDGTTDLSQHYGNLNLDLGMEWQPSENHSVGFKVDHYTNLKGVGDFRMTNDIYHDGRLTDQMVSNTHTDTDHSNSWQANAYYIGSFNGWSLDCNADFYHTSVAEDARTIEESLVDERDIQSSTSTSNRLLAARISAAHTFGGGKLGFGTELVFMKRGSNYTINAEGIANSADKVEENTYAAFAEYGHKIGATGMLRAGARYEYVDFSYDDRLSPSAHVARHSGNIYPYASYSVGIGSVRGALSYAVKTCRPYFRTLRSNIEYNNRFTLTTGNPTLKNETRHELGANASWRFLSMSVGYLRTTDGIYDWTYPYNDDGTVLVGWVNLDSPINQLSAFVNVAPSVGAWMPSYTVGVQKQWLTLDLTDPRQPSGQRHASYGKPMIICNLNNAFRLPARNGKGSWQLELNSELMSACHYGNAEITNWSWNLKWAVQRTFLPSDALSVRLEATDIFHTAYNNVVVDLGNNILTQTHILGRERSCYDQQRLTLTLRYSFNVSRSDYRGKGAGRSVADRM